MSYFEDTEYLMPDVSKEYKDTENPVILKDLMEYIDKIKSNDRETSIMEIIIDYSFKNNYDVDHMGDIIASDEYFKSFVEADCSFRSIKNIDW